MNYVLSFDETGKPVLKPVVTTGFDGAIEMIEENYRKNLEFYQRTQKENEGGK
jgi:hypothetical protein